ncbi:MAG: hypothetical protein V1846_01435 [Candidatus Komeilibacteria bacterium]
MFWDYWDKYKFQMVAGAIIIVTLGVWLGFIIAGQTRVRDITLMSQLSSLASGLERYYGQHAGYPESVGLDLRQGVVVNDSGISNSNGGAGIIYYLGEVTAGKATYTSDGQGYQISFKLQRKWPVVGVSKKSCVIKENYQISCS